MMVELQKKNENAILSCEDVTEVMAIVKDYPLIKEMWKDFINEEFKNGNFTFEGLSKQSSISRNTLKKWCKNGDVPYSREQYLKLCIGMKLPLYKVNYVLQYFGRYSKLYSRSFEDAIYIYVINHYSDDERPIDMVNRLKEEYVDIIKIKNRRLFEKNPSVTTTRNDYALANMPSEDEFEKFVEENQDDFINSYYELLDYIEAYIKAENKQLSYHYMIEAMELDQGFDVMMSKLRHWGEVPARNRLIAIGIYLNMSVDEMNRMLEYAKMLPLCAADKVESVIMFVLTNIHLNYPEYELEHAKLVAVFSESDKLRSEMRQFIIKQMELHSSVEQCSEIDEYVKEILSNMNVEEAEELLKYL